MIDDVRMIEREDLLETRNVADTADENGEVQLRMAAFQLHLYIIGVVLVNVKDNQLFRPVRGNLTAELGTDGTAAACDKDDLVGDVAGDFP